MKFALALGNCWGFCRRKSVFSLMCISKLLQRQNIFRHFLSKLPWLQLSIIKKWRKKTTKCDHLIKLFFFYLVGTEESAGGVIQGCSVIRFFEKLRKIHSKIPVPQSLFNEVSGLEICNVVKKWLQQRCEFCEDLRNTYLRTAASESVRY